MSNQRDELLSKLQSMLSWKKSRKFYAEKLEITETEVDELLREIRQQSTQDVDTEAITGNYIADLEETIVKINKDRGTLESTVISSFEPKTDEEWAELHKVNLTKYKISSYWTKQRGTKFTTSLHCTLIKDESKEVFQAGFVEFLQTYSPSLEIFKVPVYENYPKISLILPKQDAHYNKYDIEGRNSIDERFERSKESIANMLCKSISVNALDEVVYVVGSDQFNSEWTSMTTKGTPQVNILTHHEAFQKICNYEVEVINTLLSYSSRVKIVFIPGNHDEFVGWHLVNWLEMYFRNESRIEFDTSILNTKYHRYGNSAIMFNHGDDINPKELAHKFPVGFKDEWSLCNYQYIFTGDKHKEMSLDIHGIKFYQVPQLSSAISKWDDKKGYRDGKAEMTAFVITSDNGMSDIYKDVL